MDSSEDNSVTANFVPPPLDPITQGELLIKENLTLPNGAVYTGQMKMVRRSSISYSSEMSDKQVLTKHGHGKQIWPDGAEYEGEWRNGMAHG
mmetsp:Transcript_15966/g.24745  ORF Transcript_15966/g.24745 Transcript_15966/m.24745 type:complete len:92 (+) Transcript_15966:120-395(+)